MPNNRRVMLSSVKTGIPHPRNLPSLRRMDMDDVLHRPPRLHCRTSVTSQAPNRGCHGNASDFRPLTSQPSMRTGRAAAGYQGLKWTPSLDLLGYKDSKGRIDWSQCLSPAGKFQLPTVARQQQKDLRFSCYAVRHQKPEFCGNSGKNLVQEPSLIWTGRCWNQRPTPDDINKRYRGGGFFSLRNNVNPWK